MDNQSIRELRTTLKSMRAGDQAANASSSATIDYLQSLLASTVDAESRADLYDFLSTECMRYGKGDLRNALLTQFVSEQPENLVARCMLASALASQPGQSESAVQVLDDAIALARDKNQLVRYTLTYKARIALDLGNYEALREALLGLIDDKDSVRQEDTPYEFDFLPRIDGPRLDRSIVEDYARLASKM